MTADRVWQCPLCDHTQQFWFELDTTAPGKSGWEWPSQPIMVAGHYVDNHPEEIEIVTSPGGSWYANYPNKPLTVLKWRASTDKWST